MKNSVVVTFDLTIQAPGMSDSKISCSVATSDAQIANSRQGPGPWADYAAQRLWHGVERAVIENLRQAATNVIEKHEEQEAELEKLANAARGIPYLGTFEGAD